MRKHHAPRPGESAGAPTARLLSIPIGAGDAFLLPVHGLIGMWSGRIFVGALVLLVAGLLGQACAMAFAWVHQGAVVKLAGSAILSIAFWAATMPLLRATSRGEDCGWHLDAAEQSPAGIAFGRTALTSGAWAVGVALLLASLQWLHELAARQSPVFAAIVFVPILLLTPSVLGMLSIAALARNAVESRPALSSLREAGRRIPWMNALKGGTLAMVIPALVMLACGVILLFALRGAFAGRSPDLLGAFALTVVLAPLALAQAAAKHPVLACLIAVAVVLPLLMLSLATLLAYVDRTLERDADPAGAGDGATDPDPVAPTRWVPLSLPDTTPPADAAAQAWKAHRDLRGVDDDAARQVMLANARAHLAAIVSHRTGDEALLVYRDCAAVEPGFEPGPAARVGLARAALANRQPALALDLISGFDRRFGGHPQVPVAYGIAHEALTATGRHALADRVLAALRQRHPDHPLTVRLAGVARTAD
ncbi:MAG: hypothetical protein AB7P21_01265 [Lautropia sp.]